MMRRLLLIFAISFVFTGCSKSDDGNNLEPNDLKGTWLLTTEPHKYNYHPECNIDKETMEITSANSIYRTLYGGNNTSVSDCDEAEERKFSSIFYLQINIIELKDFDPDPDYIEEYNIISISKDKMVIELYFMQLGGASVDGEPLTITIPEEERVHETWVRIE